MCCQLFLKCDGCAVHQGSLPVGYHCKCYQLSHRVSVLYVHALLLSMVELELTLDHSALISNEDGFISADLTHRLVILAFKRSISLRNWIADFAVPQVACVFGFGCLVHAG